MTITANNNKNNNTNDVGISHHLHQQQVHSVRIKAGKATYSNRYVRTKKLAAEEKAGEAFDLK